MKLLSNVRLFATPLAVAYQASLSMEFSRQEYWSGLPFPSPGDLPDPGIESGSPTLQADVLPSEPPGDKGSLNFIHFCLKMSSSICHHLTRLNLSGSLIPSLLFLCLRILLISHMWSYIFWDPDVCFSFVSYNKLYLLFSQSSWPTLQAQELQHARLPWPSPSPELCSNWHPLSQWCHPNIWSSVIPLSSCLQSFPTSGSFLMSQLFA